MKPESGGGFSASPETVFLTTITNLMFVAIGVFLWWGVFLSPLVKSQTSGDWVQTPCTIVASKVHVDARQRHYRPEIKFTYRVNGEQHYSQQYDFTALNRRKSRCQAIVDANIVESDRQCFYDPDAPTDAVIVREYDFSFFGFLFPLIFIVLGMGGLIVTKRSSKNRSAD